MPALKRQNGCSELWKQHMAILQGLIRYSLLTKRSIIFPTATPIKSSITKKMKNLVVLCLLWFLLQLVTTSLLNLHVYYITGHPVAFGWLENSDRKNGSHVHVADRYLNNERLVLSEVQVSLRNFLRPSLQLSGSFRNLQKTITIRLAHW